MNMTNEDKIYNLVFTAGKISNSILTIENIFRMNMDIIDRIYEDKKPLGHIFSDSNEDIYLQYAESKNLYIKEIWGGDDNKFKGYNMCKNPNIRLKDLPYNEFYINNVPDKTISEYMDYKIDICDRFNNFECAILYGYPDKKPYEINKYGGMEKNILRLLNYKHYLREEIEYIRNNNIPNERII